MLIDNKVIENINNEHSNELFSKIWSMSDEEVVHLAQNGISLAQEILFERYKSLIESKQRTYFLAGADKDDVIQEGMLGFCKAIRDYSPKRMDCFRPFADICITRQIITAVKTSRRNKHTPLNNSISLQQHVHEEHSEITLQDMLPDSKSTQQFIDENNNNEISNIYYIIRGGLTPLENKVLELYLDGKSYGEMSELLQCGTKSIDNALQRIKKKLLHLFHKQNQNPDEFVSMK